MNNKIICAIFVFLTFHIVANAQYELRIGMGGYAYYFKYGKGFIPQSDNYSYKYGPSNRNFKKFTQKSTNGISITYLRPFQDVLSLGFTIDFTLDNFLTNGYSFFSDTTALDNKKTVFNSNVNYTIYESILNAQLVVERYFGLNRNIVTFATVGLHRSRCIVNMNVTSTLPTDPNTDVLENLNFSTTNLNIIYSLGAGYKIKIKNINLLPSISFGGIVFPSYFGAEYYRVKINPALIFIPKISVKLPI